MYTNFFSLEVDCMATKSMLKDIEIKDKKLGNDFAKSLEVAFARATSNVNAEPMKRECKELTGEEINKFFNM